MKHLILASAIGLLCVTAATAADDPIATRENLMKGQGKAFLGDLGKMQKGDAPYDQAMVDKTLATIVASAQKAPDLFPDGSQSGEKTRALPAIWTAKADIATRFKKLGADAAAQQGKIVDVASLKTGWDSISKDCNDCHKLYRAPSKD